MTLQPGLHPRLLGLILQSDPLKPGSCKFNVINNIINIAFELVLQSNPRFFGIAMQKDLTLLDLSFFLYFLYKKN